MRIGDGILGLFFVLFAAGVLWHVRGFPSLPGQFYGPGFFPGIILVCLLACGVMLIARGVRESSHGGFTIIAPAWRAAPRGAISALFLFFSVLAFYFLGEDLGFLPLMFGALLVLYLWLGRGLAWSFGLAGGLTIAIDILFREVLRVPIPTGIFPPLW